MEFSWKCVKKDYLYHPYFRSFFRATQLSSQKSKPFLTMWVGFILHWKSMKSLWFFLGWVILKISWMKTIFWDWNSLGTLSFVVFFLVCVFWLWQSISPESSVSDVRNKKWRIKIKTFIYFSLFSLDTF